MTSNSMQILLVDDDPAVLQLLRKWLQSADYAVSIATDGKEARQLISQIGPHLLITDWEMPQLDGPGLCRWVRQQKTPHYIYTILLTSRGTQQDTIMGLEAGADDFVKKPIDRDELLARVRAASRILELESRLSLIAQTDPLTGLFIRRTFVETVEREWARSTRHLLPISCVMIDIDYFKRINDTHGHRAGDHALQAVAKILQDSCRANDLVGRYGGEEFCVLLPETTEEYAITWAERVRAAIASATGLVRGIDVQLTASFGVAQRLADTRTPEELVDLADQALLVAKRSGRDRVVGFQAIRVDGLPQFAPGDITDLMRTKTARDVMTTIVAGLQADDTIGNATQHFLRFSFNSAPVIDRNGKLVGILSERDVMSLMLLPNWRRTKVREVMRCNVVSYEEDTPILLIYEFLYRVSMRGVVIAREGRPVGMISRASLLRWFTNQLAFDPNDDGSVKGRALANGPPELRTNPTEGAVKVAHSIVVEANAMEQRIRQDPEGRVPIVFAGVSRIEELINELVAHTRTHAVGGPDNGLLTEDGPGSYRSSDLLGTLNPTSH